MSTDTSTEAPVAGEDTVGAPVPWHGVLVPEGVPTGDGRQIAAGGLTSRDLPIPLRWVKEDKGYHDGAVVVGNITSIWRDGNLIKAEGLMRNDSEAADEVIAMLATKMIRGVSVDLDDIAFEVDESPVAEGRPEMVTMNEARIAAATIVDIPAFQEAWIALGLWPDGAPSAEASLVASCGCSDLANGLEDLPSLDGDEPALPAEGDRVTFEGPEGEMVVGTVASVDVESGTAVVDVDGGGQLEVPFEGLKPFEEPKADGDNDTGDGFAITSNPSTKDGPGWITNPQDTQRLRDYWAKGEGAAKIRWGEPGDFNRCREQLGQYVNPLFLAGTCANLHKVALGVWPGQEASAAGLERLSLDAKGGLAPVAEADALVASAASLPPAEWFQQPVLDGPTPLTITEDGMVFGHLATWDSCHIGSMPGTCKEVPHSNTEYAYFHTGVRETTGGDIAVGQITMDTGHAALKGSVGSVLAHYDNTAAVVADVRAGEDNWGIWVAGAMRSQVSDEQRVGLKAAALSGDWRGIRGNLELVAALAVNVPGFPIPRTGSMLRGGEQVALVAAGMVLPDLDAPTTAIDVASIVRETLAEHARITERTNRLAAARQALRAAKIADARAALKG